jgi:hypothetical protein
MAYSKAVVIEHLLVLDQSGKENYQTNTTIKLPYPQLFIYVQMLHTFIFTTCFSPNAPSSVEAEYNTSNYKSLLNCNTTYNKT